MKNLDDITYLNCSFVRQVRETPNADQFLIRPAHRQVVTGINSLREELVDQLCKPAASLFFTAELMDAPPEARDAGAWEWLQDYWLFVFSLARQDGDMAHFMIQTGLDSRTYRMATEAPLRSVREWAARSRITFRHTPRMWRTILQLLSSSQSAARIAPLLGVYSSSTLSLGQEAA